MNDTAYERFASICAILAGIAGLLYSIAFILVSRSNAQLGGFLSSLFLLIGGLLTLVVMAALYERLRVRTPGYALLALLLATAGAFGAVVHGGYDLANAINVPETIPANLASLPSAVDPRGLLTFGVAGLALLLIAPRLGGVGLPKGLGTLGLISAILLIILYLGRLIVLDATSLFIVVPALLEGFIINPIWYLWLGLSLPKAAGA